MQINVWLTTEGHGTVVTMGLDMMAAWCAAIPVGSGVALGLFVAGLAGSPMHCAPMCGGFVLGQVADRMARLPALHLCEWQRVRGAALLPYHSGRLTTYAALGALAGAGGSALAGLPWFGRLTALLLLLAAFLFLAQALRRLLPWLRLPGLEQAPAAWTRAVARMTAGIDRTGPAGGYLLGVALGFLPCGFLYGALAAAAASGSWWAGALGMAAFGLGTVPALIAVGLAGHAAGRRWQRGVAVLSPAVMLLNAALLAALALRGLLA